MTLCVVLALLVGCGADPGQDDAQDELMALLRDEPLSVAETPPISTAVPPRVTAIAQPPSLLPERLWSFDDCNAERTELFATSSFEIAFRSVGVTCTEGVLGRAVALAAREDIIYVPDQPFFTFENGVSVGGWFRPVGLDRPQTLFRKRDRGTSSFALMLHRGRFRFVIALADGTAASVVAPAVAKVGAFQHVAASYDGAALRLYVDGEQVAVRDVAGAIRPGAGPLLIGNDGSERRFDGAIDEAAFVLRAFSPEQVRQSTCLPVEPTVVKTPGISAPTPPDVPAIFDVAITNNNSPACVPMQFGLVMTFVPPELVVTPDLPFPEVLQNPPVPSGGTTHFTITAAAFDTIVERSTVLFTVFALDYLYFRDDFVTAVATEPAGCHVSKSRELLIDQPAVTRDPVRTATQGPAGDPRVGVWSFKHIIEEIATTPAEAPAMVEDMLRSYQTPQVINEFTVESRPQIASLLDAWPRRGDGALDLDRAPVRLVAIVNRVDLRNLDEGNAGQAEFVFRFTLPNGSPVDASWMFEYKLPAATETDVLAWAQSFHALAALPLGSEAYNGALQAITDRFVQRGAQPGGVNGSALHAVRSGEFAFGDFISFEHRQFVLSPVTGRLVPSALDRTPDQSFRGSSALGSFIIANRDAILDGDYAVPDQLAGQPFRAGAITTDGLPRWFAPGVDLEARDAFAIGTCDGCHGVETGTLFQHIGNDSVPVLSPFLRGGTQRDLDTGETRTFNDLLRRRQDLEAIVCPAEPTVSLRHGIDRVH